MIPPDNLKIKVEVDKKRGTYLVTIIDHGENMSCTELDIDGKSLNAKIVELVGRKMGNNVGEAMLTEQGEQEIRHAEGAHHTIDDLEEEHDEFGYDPLAGETHEDDPYDVGNFGI